MDTNTTKDQPDSKNMVLAGRSDRRWVTVLVADGSFTGRARTTIFLEWVPNEFGEMLDEFRYDIKVIRPNGTILKLVKDPQFAFNLASAEELEAEFSKTIKSAHRTNRSALASFIGAMAATSIAIFFIVWGFGVSFNPDVIAEIMRNQGFYWEESMVGPIRGILGVFGVVTLMGMFIAVSEYILDAVDIETLERSRDDALLRVYSPKSFVLDPEHDQLQPAPA